MQKIVVDRLRPDHESDKRGVQEARTSLQVAYEMLEKQAKDKRWIINEEFTLADCAAAPALFYATTLEPFKTEQKNCKSYFEKLMARPSVKRVIEEAKPFFLNYPYKENIPAQFL